MWPLPACSPLHGQDFFGNYLLLVALKRRADSMCNAHRIPPAAQYLQQRLDDAPECKGDLVPTQADCGLKVG